MTSVPALCVDSNVLIEAVFLPGSAAAVVTDMAIDGVFDLVTCEQVVDDVEEAILRKCGKRPDQLDIAVDRWSKLLAATRLKVLPNPPWTVVQSVYNQYIGVMRHKADIPILAAALECLPKPRVILSGNHEHFNDAVATKCGISICSCVEFIEVLARPAR